MIEITVLVAPILNVIRKIFEALLNQKKIEVEIILKEILLIRSRGFVGSNPTFKIFFDKFKFGIFQNYFKVA